MRQADLKDLERLALLEAELFSDNNLNERSLKNELSLSQCWVEERQGQFVGYLIARVTDDLVDILRVGVLQPFWGQGIATALIKRAMEEAPETMLTVRKANVQALRLYLHMGFDVVGEVTTGLEPGWVMRLTSDERQRRARLDKQ